MKKFLRVAVIATLILFTIVLVSCDKAAEFSIRFIVDDQEYARISTAGNESVQMPADPTKEGFDFKGWFWDNGSWQKPFIANSLLETPLKSDMSVYAYFVEKQKTLKGTEIEATAFDVEDTTLSIKVSNATNTFSFIDKIRTADNATFSISTDINGTDIVRSKTVELAVGYNTYYIVVENGKDIALYTAVIRRRPFYKVTFENTEEVTVYEQYVEEDDCAVKPTETLQKKGYTFKGWDFDFSKPITENKHINAIWELMVFDIEYVVDKRISDDWNDMNPSTYSIEDNGYEFKKPKGKGIFCGWYLSFPNGDYSDYMPTINFDRFLEYQKHIGKVRLYALFDENAKGEFYWDIDNKEQYLICFPDSNGDIVIPKHRYLGLNTDRLLKIWVSDIKKDPHVGNEYDIYVKTVAFQDSVSSICEILGRTNDITVKIGANVETLVYDRYGWLFSSTVSVKCLIIDSAKISNFKVKDLLQPQLDTVVQTIYIKEDADVYNFIKSAYKTVESDKDGYIKYIYEKDEV